VHTGFWWGKWGERDQLEEVGVDRRIILKGILKKEVYWGLMGGA
jgi:hypothetical protein